MAKRNQIDASLDLMEVELQRRALSGDEVANLFLSKVKSMAKKSKKSKRKSKRRY